LAGHYRISGEIGWPPAPVATPSLVHFLASRRECAQFYRIEQT
jgi:hypothetical protein